MRHKLQPYTFVLDKPVLSISQTTGTNKSVTRRGCSMNA